MRIQRLAGLLLLLPLSALAQERLDDFGSRWEIRTKAAAPYYQLSLPLAVPLASARGELSDLRVFDSSGQALAYARMSVGDRQETETRRQALNWFPLGQDEAASIEAGDIRIKQASDGTLVEIKVQSGSSGRSSEEPKLRGYLLDASRIGQRETAQALALDWQDGGDFQLLDVEASEDLQHWRTLSSGAQLARLAYQGQRIERLKIELPGFRERYLRLVWRSPAQAPKLTKAELELCHAHHLAPPLIWSTALSPDSKTTGLKPGEYRYHLPKPLPLASLRVELPPGNQLLPVEIRTSGPHGYRLANTVIYRISNQGREWLNTEIPLDNAPLQDFILKLDARLSPFPQGPKLAFSIRPEQILFLASGSPPYTLAVGQREARDAALPLSTLVPGFGQPGQPEIASASLVEKTGPSGSPSTLQGSAPDLASRLDWKRIALWAVLGLGVLGLAAMAWQLLKQMNGPKK